MRNRLLVSFFSIIGYFLSCSAHASAPNADDLVSGILSYTSWSSQLDEIRFCVVDGPAEFISPQIFNPPSPLIRPPIVKIIVTSSHKLNQLDSDSKYSTCNILYFVHTSSQEQAQVMHEYPQKVLTISEQNSECAQGSAFCLYWDKRKYNFKVNLLTLSKSGVRVNSKVLMLANTEEAQP